MITTVVGSYPKVPNRPRPARLRTALNRFDRGEGSWEEVQRVQDEVTLEVIAEQAEAGLDLVTDGQVRWDDELTYVARALSGVSLDGLTRYFDTNTYYRRPVFEGPARRSGPITVADYRFAAAHSPVPVKAVLPGPYTLARLSLDRGGGRLEPLAMALAEALHAEAAALAAAGAPVVQLNEPALTWHKEDYPLCARAVARVFAGVSCQRALYCYFGDVEGLYPQLLELPVEILGLDFVMGPRNYQVLPAAPFDRILGFGAVDARNTKRETEEQIAAQLRFISRLVPPERIHLSPNMGLEYLPREAAQEKLRTMVRAARRAEREAVA